MCGPAALTIAATAVTMAGQMYSGMAAKAEGKAEAQAMQRNIALERDRMVDARERSNVDIVQRYRAASQEVGRMRSDQAALGLDTEIGSVFANQMSTLRVAGQDVSALGRNLTNELRGFDINTANMSYAASAAKARGKNAMFSAVLGSIGTAIGGAQQLSKQAASASTGLPA